MLRFGPHLSHTRLSVRPSLSLSHMVHLSLYISLPVAHCLSVCPATFLSTSVSLFHPSRLLSNPIFCLSAQVCQTVCLFIYPSDCLCDSQSINPLRACVYALMNHITVLCSALVHICLSLSYTVSSFLFFCDEIKKKKKIQEVNESLPHLATPTSFHDIYEPCV